MERYLKRVIRIGGSIAIILPKAVSEKLEYVWIEPRGDEIIIRKAEVR